MEIPIRDANNNEGIWMYNLPNEEYELYSFDGIPNFLPKITHRALVRIIGTIYIAAVAYGDKEYFYEPPLIKHFNAFDDAAMWAQEKLIEIVEKYEKL